MVRFYFFATADPLPTSAVGGVYFPRGRPAEASSISGGERVSPVGRWTEANIPRIWLFEDRITRFLATFPNYLAVL